MDCCRHIKLVLSLSLVFIIFSSCSNNTSKKDAENNENKESVIVDENLQVSEDAILSFFVSLKAEKFDDCIGYFSDSIIMALGNDKVIEGLRSRNSQSGISDSIQIYYGAKLSTDNLYVFYIRCFSDVNVGGISYDKVVVNVTDKSPKFISYEFSPMQYCDVNMANDSLSEIHIYLTKVYSTINEKGADEAFMLLDPEVASSIDKSNFENGYAEIKSNFMSKNSFIVKSVWSEIQMGIPVINMIIESHCENLEIYIDYLMISDRLGDYFIGKIEREPKLETSVQQLPRPSDNELKPFAAEAASFYNLLIENNTEKILSKIDKSVFQNNDYNAVKNSFSARNQYYGKPTVLKNTNVKTYSISGNTVVDFSFTVGNSTGQKSYEKLSIIRNSKSKYMVYGYDFRDEQF